MVYIVALGHTFLQEIKTSLVSTVSLILQNLIYLAPMLHKLSY